MKEINLEELKASPVTDYFEMSDVETVLSRVHPLGYKKAIGKRMAYSVEYRGEWVAVLLFDVPVDANKLRESRIGWTKSQMQERRKHVANNSRFAVLPKYQGVKNLASKSLSLVASRISKDWLRQYGIPLLALETYVDPIHNNNQGSCYKACGWEELGLSTGYMVDGERTHRKIYFLKELHPDSYKALSSDIPHALITGIKSVSKESNNNFVYDAGKISLKELQEHLSKTIIDYRKPISRKYKLIPLLSFCISAVLSGYTQYRQIADWISKIPANQRVEFGLPGDDTPHESTIGKIFAKLDATQLKDAINTWLIKTYNDPKLKVISLDGKAVRGTATDLKKQRGFLNVYADELGIVIEQLPTKKGAGEKSTAIQAIKNLPEEICKGKIIMADALHTSEEMIEEIKKKVVATS
jgi:hypothetical protein